MVPQRRVRDAEVFADRDAVRAAKASDESQVMDGVADEELEFAAC